MLVLCALLEILIRRRFAVAKRSGDDYEKDFVLDGFRAKNEGIKAVFSAPNRSLTCAIDAVYVGSKSRCFKLVIPVYTIYLMKNVENSHRFRWLSHQKFQGWTLIPRFSRKGDISLADYFSGVSR
jgi:hypothetical protein